MYGGGRIQEKENVGGGIKHDWMEGVVVSIVGRILDLIKGPGGKKYQEKNISTSKYQNWVFHIDKVENKIFLIELILFSPRLLWHNKTVIRGGDLKKVKKEGKWGET